LKLHPNRGENGRESSRTERTGPGWAIHVPTPSPSGPSRPCAAGSPQSGMDTQQRQQQPEQRWAHVHIFMNVCNWTRGCQNDENEYAIRTAPAASLPSSIVMLIRLARDRPVLWPVSPGDNRARADRQPLIIGSSTRPDHILVPSHPMKVLHNAMILTKKCHNAKERTAQLPPRHVRVLG
jgi:hypothetical protein